MTNLSNINDIARACGKPKRTSRGVAFLCPCHQDRNPSCVAWYGDVAIRVRCFAGCDRFDVLDALRGMGFTLSLHEKAAREARDLSVVKVARRKALDAGCAMRTRCARQLWEESSPARSSPVEHYLAKRGLALSVVPNLNQTIRYHPRCPRGKLRQRAMICAMRDVATDEIVGVHRTFLTADLRKDGQPMMLGSPDETAIKLSGHGIFGARHLCPLLHVCEGVETGIGALMLGYAPLWSLMTEGGIARFAPMLGIEELCVLADHDRIHVNPNTGRWRQPGPDAARACVRVWIEAGWRAHMTMPRNEGEDYADIAKEMAA